MWNENYRDEEDEELTDNFIGTVIIVGIWALVKLAGLFGLFASYKEATM